jgi:hypothetical protein
MPLNKGLYRAVSKWFTVGCFRCKKKERGALARDIGTVETEKSKGFKRGKI